MLGQVSADYVHAKHPCYPQSRQRMPQEPQEPQLCCLFFLFAWYKKTTPIQTDINSQKYETYHNSDCHKAHDRAMSL